MKELFVGFLNVSMSGSLIIAAVLLLRLLFRKAPKALICLLWVISFVRLLLPFRIETGWSLRPELPAVSVQQTYHQMQTVAAVAPPVPDAAPGTAGEMMANTAPDFLWIAAAVWACVALGMLVYMILSYGILKHSVRESVRVRPGIFESAQLDSAFLLGYFAPKIYLPSGMEPDAADLVIAHEEAHCKRLDNWTKLLGFVCLAIHWFNPLVWTAYIALCKDVEDACDERTIRNLDAMGRKAYSAALLSCGRKVKLLSVCPVAFGEVSVGRRIRNVLNYRKPALWICVGLVIVIVVMSVFFMTDPLQKHPAYYKELMNLLGETKQTVFRELALSESDVTAVDQYFYETPLIVEYQGVRMRVSLYFTRGTDLLSAFQYAGTLDGTVEENAAIVSDFAKHTVRSYGRPYQAADRDETIADTLSEGNIRDLFEDAPDRVFGDTWDLTPYASKSVKTYLDQIEVSSLWQEAHGDRARRYNISPHYYVSFRAYSDTEAAVCHLSLEYKTGWQPGQYQQIIKSDIDPMKATYVFKRWWSEAFDWLK